MPLEELDEDGSIYVSQGKYEKAKPLFCSALEMSKRLLGEEHLDVASNQLNLGCLCLMQCRYSEAEALYRQSLAIAQSKLGCDHPITQGILSWLQSSPQSSA